MIWTVSEKVNYPQARFLLEEEEKKYHKRKFSDVDKLNPLYLHPQDCQVKKIIKTIPKKKKK